LESTKGKLDKKKEEMHLLVNAIWFALQHHQLFTHHHAMKAIKIVNNLLNEHGHL
jgi:hypothetical protein